MTFSTCIMNLLFSNFFLLEKFENNIGSMEGKLSFDIVENEDLKNLKLVYFSWEAC